MRPTPVVLALALALVAGCKDRRYAALRDKLDKVGAAQEGAAFDLGESDATFLVGRSKVEILANLRGPDMCYDGVRGPPCPPEAGWVYFFCHHPSGYRGGCSTLVIEFEAETCSKVRWEYGK